MDVAEGVHVAFAVVEEEEVGGDAGEEGGDGGKEEGGHGGLMCSGLGEGLWLREMVKGRHSCLPLYFVSGHAMMARGQVGGTASSW